MARVSDNLIGEECFGRGGEDGGVTPPGPPKPDVVKISRGSRVLNFHYQERLAGRHSAQIKQ
jgi:hypothetical protein